MQITSTYLFMQVTSTKPQWLMDWRPRARVLQQGEHTHTHSLARVQVCRSKVSILIDSFTPTTYLMVVTSDPCTLPAATQVKFRSWSSFVTFTRRPLLCSSLEGVLLVYLVRLT